MAEEKSAYAYDVISDPSKRLAHEGEFLLWLLSTALGGRVLDMACATGVHAEFMARHGAAVTARDVDEDAVCYAGEKRPHANVTYEVHDLRVAKGGPFDLIMVMGNTLSLLGGIEDVERAFLAVSGMLAPRGVAFAHVVNYAALEAGGPRQKVARKTTQGLDLVVVKDMVPSGEGGPALVSLSYFERKGEVWRTWGSRSVLLNLRKSALIEAAAGAGLAVETVYGDYDRSGFDEKRSPDLLLVLRNTEVPR